MQKKVPSPSDDRYLLFTLTPFNALQFYSDLFMGSLISILVPSLTLL